jgi:hypothetical protein
MYRKSKLGFSLVTLMILTMFVGLLPIQSAEAAATTFYVATTGDDSNLGTLAAPFKTINKCAQIVQPGDTCLIASGTYRETVTPANSGTSEQPIKFEAAPGAHVVVSSTEQVSGWTPYSGNIYVADLSWSLGHENQLFVNDGTTVTPLWEARWPNITEYTFPGLQDGMAVAQSGSEFTLSDPALNQPNDYWKGATIWERGGDAYVGQTSKVVGFDQASSTITFAPINGNYDYMWPKLGSTYYLMGILTELDAPNEWYVDEAAQKVYLWAPNGGVPSDVEVKKRKIAINLNNKSFIQITGIKTFGGSIPMNNANNNVLDRVQAEYLYFSNKTNGTSVHHQLTGGINIVGNNNEIKNGTVAHSSGTLINIDGDHNRIVNNSIHDGSYMASYDPLVKLTKGVMNLISHNEIRDSGRFNIYWSSGSAEIQYNDIYNGMWLSRDGALIYSWGADMGNSEIHHNVIRDSQGTDMSVGLYFDNFSTKAVAHHNVIYNHDVGIQLNTPGNFKLIYNNTVVNNTLSSIGYWGTAPYREELYGTRVFNNIFTDPVSLTTDTVSGYNTESASGLNFVNAAAKDFRLNAGSTAINTGAVIAGITEGYVGTAPDAGAYEYGGADWTVGPDFVNPPNPVQTPIDTQYLNLVKNSTFGSLDNWLKWSENTTTVVQVPTSAATPAWEKRGYQTKLRLSTGGGVEQKVTGLKPDTEYKFVAWVYNEPGETINIGVLNYGGNAIDISSKDEQYTRKEVVFRTGPTNEDARVRIFKGNATTGFSYADDVGLFEITPFDPGVSQSLLKDVKITAPAFVYTAGDQGTLSLNGTLQNGSAADLSTAVVEYTSSDSSVFNIHNSGQAAAAFTAIAPGQVTITATVTMDGITKAATQAITVFPLNDEPVGTDWTVRQYGPNSRGFVTEKDGAYSLIGIADNVWNTADDFVYLSKFVQLDNPNTKVTLTATIDSLSSPDPASVGLMLRSEDTVNSKHVHFRFDGNGQVLRYVFRNEESILDAQKPPAQQKYWGSETGLLLDYAGKSVTAPFQIKLIKEGNTVSGYYVKDAAWFYIGATTVEFSSSNFLAGIGMYSGAGKPPVKAVISDLLVQVDRELSQVTLTADQTTLGAADTAVLSVSGLMSDGSQADLSQAAIVYTSGNEQVVTVDASGIVTAVGDGTADVTASVTVGGTTLTGSTTFTVDVTAPILTVQLDRTSIWPPNHKMVNVNATLTSSDPSGIESVILTSITSNVPGSAHNDIQAQIGTAATSFSLRAEKNRIYTVTYTATDMAGNQTAATATVTVPHDQSGNNN